MGAGTRHQCGKEDRQRFAGFQPKRPGRCGKTRGLPVWLGGCRALRRMAHDKAAGKSPRLGACLRYSKWPRARQIFPSIEAEPTRLGRYPIKEATTTSEGKSARTRRGWLTRNTQTGSLPAETKLKSDKRRSASGRSEVDPGAVQGWDACVPRVTMGPERSSGRATRMVAQGLRVAGTAPRNGRHKNGRWPAFPMD